MKIKKIYPKKIFQTLFILALTTQPFAIYSNTPNTQTKTVVQTTKPKTALPIKIPTYTKEEGALFLKAALKKWPMIENYLGKIQELEYESDAVLYPIENYGFYSPATLHSVKIACDILFDYEDRLPQMNIVEIQGGDSLLCKILYETCGYGSYTIIASERGVANAKNKLKDFSLPNLEYFNALNIPTNGAYDLVISDHGLLSLYSRQRNACLESIIDKTAQGYLLMNFGSKNHYCTAEDMLARLLNASRKGTIECEAFRKAETKPNKPISNTDNQIVTWSPNDEIYSTLYKMSANADIESFQATHCAITYSLSNGRLGDNLVAFMHGLWMAKKYDLPLICRPFEFSTEFALSQKYPQTYLTGSYETYTQLNSEWDLLRSKDKTLLTIPYYPEARDEYEDRDFIKTLNIAINRDDPDFRPVMLEALTLIEPIATLQLPTDRLTVAVHVRRGGAFEDYNFHKYSVPCKVPMDWFYTESLTRILKIYPNTPIYAHIFTDDQDPDSILASFSELFKDSNITFGINHENEFNNPLHHLMYDLFSMSKFDCLIRAQSNFSTCSEYIGQHELVFYPIGYALDGKEPVFNQVEMRFKKKIL